MRGVQVIVHGGGTRYYSEGSSSYHFRGARVIVLRGPRVIILGVRWLLL